MHIDQKFIEPLANFCLVEKSETEIETTSGITMSEAQAYATPTLGTVLKAGSQSQFKPGDIVFFRRYSVDELKFVTDQGEQVIWLVQDTDVVAQYIPQPVV